MSSPSIAEISERLKSGELDRIEARKIVTSILKEKEEKLEEAVAELKKEYAIDFFQPNCTKQARFICTRKREAYAFGGNQTGKSEGRSVRTGRVMNGTSPLFKEKYKKGELVRGWVGGVSWTKLKDNVEPKLMKYVNKDVIEPGYPKGDMRLGRDLKTKYAHISYKTYNTDPVEWGGEPLDFVDLDEQPPKPIFDQVRQRVTTRHGYIWCGMTPEECLKKYGDLWMLKKIVRPYQRNPEMRKDTFVTYLTKWDNVKYLGVNEVKRQKRLLKETSELHYRVSFLGEWAEVLGRVLPGWIDDKPYVVADFEILKYWNIYVALDCHEREPWRIVWLALTPDNYFYVIRCLSGEFGWTVKDYMEAVKIIENELPPITSRFMECRYATKPSTDTGRTTQEVLEELGYWWESWSAHSEGAIPLLQDYLRLRQDGKPNLIVFKSCTEVINEFLDYSWDDYIGYRRDDVLPKQKTKTFGDHCIAGIKAILQENPIWFDPEFIESMPVIEETSGTVLGYRKRT